MLFEILFFGVPAASLLFFAVCLALYLSARKRKKQRDETLTDGAYRLRRDLLIASSVIAGVTVGIAAAFVGLVMSIAMVGM